jgi:DNA-directed RNA polymerase specialized sigma24 family protein
MELISEALSYERLEGEWLERARIARKFVIQVDAQDREDLMHDIIVRLTDVAREYQEKGKPLTRWGMIRVAQYTRLRYYHQKKRWARVAGISLNSVVRGNDGDETEMIDTLADDKAIDLDSWLDAKTCYLSSPKRVREAVQKRISGAQLSGWEWKLLRRFRSEYEILTSR